MKAILSKEAGGYDLYRIDEDGKRVTFASTQDYKQKLSLKNCQAIERGYDLDELAENYGIENGLDLGCFDEVKNSKTDFKSGFQKAIELLGGKKFSEEDVKKAIHFGASWREQLFNGTKEISELFESLQQTEWDVEIEMGGYRFNDDGQKIGFPSYELPKLDADGCLILKTFKSE